MPTLQGKLLTTALSRVKLGGVVVYSTCSIEPEENSSVVEAACHFRTSLRVVETRELIPGHPSDGGFQCLLVSGTP